MAESFRAVRPKGDEHNPYYSIYIDRLPDGDIVDTLERQLPRATEFLRSIPASKADHRYAEGKWSVKQIIGHLADSERVFQYRAMRFSRADATPVAGFDENLYVANSRFASASIADLIREFEHLRHASVLMLRALDEEGFGRSGVANNHAVTVRALAWVMAGHVDHHMEIIRTRYLAS